MSENTLERKRAKRWPDKADGRQIWAVREEDGALQIEIGNALTNEHGYEELYLFKSEADALVEVLEELYGDTE